MGDIPLTGGRAIGPTGGLRQASTVRRNVTNWTNTGMPTDSRFENPGKLPLALLGTNQKSANPGRFLLFPLPGPMPTIEPTRVQVALLATMMIGCVSQRGTTSPLSPRESDCEYTREISNGSGGRGTRRTIRDCRERHHVNAFAIARLRVTVMAVYTASMPDEVVEMEATKMNGNHVATTSFRVVILFLFGGNCGTWPRAGPR